MTAIGVTQLRVAGDTHVGKVRTTNEDAMICDSLRGLYVVLDGMGGANAGDIASQTARDAIREFIVHRRLTLAPKQLLEGAIQHGCAEVWKSAQAARERHGMGTTVVACLVIDPKRAVIAHVGDSRAYLLRHGRLQALTRDHTVVEELVARGQLSPDEVDRHPYKNVLSRNLGAKAETRVDSLELDLLPGDRLMLCSDGLYGYASLEAMQYLVGSGDAPESIARDLIDLALRGGGGDNVSTIVIEVPGSSPSSTQVVQTEGAAAWWEKRARFLEVAKDRGLTTNPICRALAGDEALEVVALPLCEAITHDLERSTGVNVWTFAQNIAGGWFDRGGKWYALRGLMDILTIAARTVVEEITAADPKLGFLLDVAVSRVLVVAELALGGLLAERLRQVETDLIALQSSVTEPHDTIDTEAAELETDPRFIEQATIPFLRADAAGPDVTPELATAIEKTLTIARSRTAQRAELVQQILGSLAAIAKDASAAFTGATELYASRALDDTGLNQVFDALDSARVIVTSSVLQASLPDATRASVLRVLSFAQQRLTHTVTTLVIEATAPFTERLKAAQQATLALRDRVAEAEQRRADLERKFATTMEQTLPSDIFRAVEP